MKVLFVTAGLGMGGAERWILSLCRYFRRAEVSGIYVHGDHYEASMVQEARNLGIPLLVPTERVDCDIVVTWGVPDVRSVVGETRRPIVEVSHGGPELSGELNLLRHSAPQATAWAAVSEDARSSFPPEYRDKVVVIRNGADPERVKPMRSPEYYRGRWGLERDQKAVLQLGRLVEAKRPDRLIASAPYLPTSFVPVFVGYGNLLPACVEQARRGIRRIVFDSPKVDVGGILAAADVLCMPSESEGGPLVMLEAWLARVPVVAAPFPCAQELRAEHGGVFTVVRQPDDPRDLSEAIVTASECDPERAYEVAREHYTAEIMAAQWEEFLESLL